MRSTWAMPLLLAGATIAALVAALAGDGWPDILSWAALACPVAAAGWALAARRS